MNRHVLRLAWYRFAATFGRRWAGYLSIVLLIGLLGGLALGSVAGARRTESSFPTFLASTNPSDLDVITGPVPVGVFARLPRVARVERATFFTNAVLLGKNGVPSKRRSAAHAYAVGSVDGLYFNQDRATVVQGRMANPKRADEAVMSAEGARLLGAHVGETVRVGFYTDAQTNLPGFGRAAVRPRYKIDITLVGVVVPNNAVVQDDAERSI